MKDPKNFNRRQFLGGSALLAGATLLPWSQALWAAEQASEGGILRISVGQAASVLNPLKARVYPEYMLAELLYSGLTRLRPDMQVEADLAESWSANEDLTVWSFELRKNLTFHDGSPCTAKDAAASLNAILDPDNAATGRKNIGPIQSIAVTGEHSLEVTLTQPYADFPVNLAYPAAKIIPASIAQGNLDELSTKAVGTGPFKLVSFEPERMIVVTRNENYYDPARPYLDGIEVVVYPDPTAEGSALISGDTDLMASAQATEYRRFEDASGVNALRVPSGQFLNVNMACDQKPFDDVRVRQALALCIDRNAMIDFVAEGYGTAGNDSPVNSAYNFYKDLPLRQVNIDKARQLLADAGYADGLKISLVASDKPSTRAQLAIAIREMAKPAGFDISVETMAHSTYLDQVWKKGNFYVGFYNMQPNEDSIFSLLYISDAAWNETRWNNKDFDALVKAAQQTADEAKRAELYGKAQALMHEEVPSIVPAFFDLLAAQRDYVEGYQLNPRGAVFRLDQVSLSDKAPKRG